MLAGMPVLCAAADYHDTAAECHLLDSHTLLQQTELQTDSPQPPEQSYRRLLSRFVSLHYNKVARDILQGEGDYLNTLEHLLGTQPADSQPCQQLFRDMLLSSPGSGGFTQALLMERLPTTAAQDTPAAQESGTATTYPAGP